VVSFAQGSSPNCAGTSPFPHPCYTPGPGLLDLVTQITFGEEYGLKSSLCRLLHFPVSSSLLGPDVFLSTLFFNILSLCSSLSMTDQVLNPYKTTGNIIVLYILSHAFANNLLYKEEALEVDGF